MAEGVRFEFEQPAWLRIDGQNLVWTIVNTGDVANEPGQETDLIHVARRKVEGPSWATPGEVDTTPWEFHQPVDAVVEPGTKHTSTFPLTWQGIEDGAYTVTVWLQENAHQIMAELYFRIDNGQPVIDSY